MPVTQAENIHHPLEANSINTAGYSLKIKVNAAAVRRPAGILSPLRYPGGKRRLTNYLAEALRLNQLRPALFVEPFAGGASVALQLLRDDHVDSIALGEKDPLVADFWKTVFYDSAWLIKKIARTRPTLQNWTHFKHGPHRTVRQRALACLFLNRTSFSGLLTPDAGPIGGYGQASDYKIDCRYAQQEMLHRLAQLAALAPRVRFVQKGDWQRTLHTVAQQGYAADEVFYYVDPPYFKKADKLYRFFFDLPDHQRLCQQLQQLAPPWILSYDAALPIIDMYQQQSHVNRVELLYSISNGSGLLKAEELIISNLEHLPSQYKAFDTSTGTIAKPYAVPDTPAVLC